MTTRSRTVNVRTPEHRWSGADTSTREGLIAGVVAALGVGACLVAIDFIAGKPFNSALAWWSSMALLFDFGAWAQHPVVGLVGYALMHFAIFLALGKVAAVVVDLGRADHAFRFAAIFAFVLAQLMFVGFIAVVHDLALGSVTTCIDLLAGSFVGSALIAAFLLRDRVSESSVTALRWFGSFNIRTIRNEIRTPSEY
jgi:hypothetical protein